MTKGERKNMKPSAKWFSVFVISIAIVVVGINLGESQFVDDRWFTRHGFIVLLLGLVTVPSAIILARMEDIRQYALMSAFIGMGTFVGAFSFHLFTLSVQDSVSYVEMALMHTTLVLLLNSIIWVGYQLLARVAAREDYEKAHNIRRR